MVRLQPLDRPRSVIALTAPALPLREIHDVLLESRKVVVDGTPNHCEVNRIIAVDQRIAHAVSQVEPKIRVLPCETWIRRNDLVCSLADDLEVRMTAS